MFFLGFKGMGIYKYTLESRNQITPPPATYPSSAATPATHRPNASRSPPSESISCCWQRKNWRRRSVQMARGNGNGCPSIITCSSQRRSKRLCKTIPPQLPDDIIADILKRLPTEYLHSVVRNVCKTWNGVLRVPWFIHSQIPYSESLLIIQRSSDPHRNHIELLKVTESESVFVDLDCPIPGEVVASCSGIILMRRKSPEALFAANPVTKQFVELPEAPPGVAFDMQWATIARIPDSGEFKVVCRGKDQRQLESTCLSDWYVLTLGSKMSWRRLKTREPPLFKEMMGMLYTNAGLKSASCAGKWYLSFRDERTMEFLWVIDLVTETTFYIEPPRRRHAELYSLISRNDRVCYVLHEPKQLMIRFLELKDPFASAWEWVCIKTIQITDFLPLYIRLPRAWLPQQRVWIFDFVGGWQLSSDDATLVAYFERTGKFKFIKETGPNARPFLRGTHQSSLISLP